MQVPQLNLHTITMVLHKYCMWYISSWDILYTTEYYTRTLHVVLSSVSVTACSLPHPQSWIQYGNENRNWKLSGHSNLPRPLVIIKLTRPRQPNERRPEILSNLSSRTPVVRVVVLVVVDHCRPLSTKMYRKLYH